MRCAWKELLSILPVWLRPEVDKLGKDSLLELRLRINAPPELVLDGKFQNLDRIVSSDDLNYVVSIASRYSPWAAASTAKGYITAPGGHRIGLCGEVVYKDGSVTGIRELHSLCIRIARDFPGIARELAKVSGSVLILGAPGWGKTTLLRDLARQIADQETVCVVDEREELYPAGFLPGRRMDILTGCAKAVGIEMLLRTMGPSCIVVDEITSSEDCIAIGQARGCGIRLLATAHAGSMSDFRSRPVYRTLLQDGIFPNIVVLRENRSYNLERMTL